MGSVPDDQKLIRCRPLIDSAAKQFALQHVLPWHLSELKTAAFDGLQDTSDKYTDSLGMPFERQAQQWIFKKAAAKGSRLRARLDAEEYERTERQHMEQVSFRAELTEGGVERMEVVSA